MPVAGGPEILVILIMIVLSYSATGPATPNGLMSVTTVLHGLWRTIAGEPVIQITQRITGWSRL